MSWRHQTAQKRIKKLIEDAPTFSVQDFNDYMPLYEAHRTALMAQKQAVTPPLFSLEKGKAVVVDTVQIYIAITNYDEYRLEEERETEASHEKALRFLHLHYSAADRVIEQSSAQRVDFHGGRMHAVVLGQSGQGVTRETIAEAFAFIHDLQLVADEANRTLAGNEFTARFRIGVDVGTCVAINNGTSGEQEPMFLGSAANHAAKLADGDQPGVYVSDRVRALLNVPELGVLERFSGLDQNFVSLNAARRSDDGTIVFGVQDAMSKSTALLSDWRSEIHNGTMPNITDPSFKFSYKQPPLSEIDYSELSPSRSVRMPLVSMFADLSGYTDYVDEAVQAGKIAEAVLALFVIRQEFQNVVEADFGGRKVRFIGDCIHAVIAEGDRLQANERGSVSLAAKCAGGLRSSFELCQQELDGIEALGLAIGAELGPTPITRVGIRGERSVRLVSSVASSRSEQMQQECPENGTLFGPKALKAAPSALNDIFDEQGFSSDMNFEDVTTCLSEFTPPTTSTPLYARAHSTSNVSTPRAHLKAK